MNVRRVTSGEIVVGRPLRASIYDENGQLLLKRGYVITANDIPKSIGAIVFEQEAPGSGAQQAPEDEKEKSTDQIVDQKDSPFEQLDVIQFRLTSLYKNITVERDFKSKVTMLTTIMEEVCKNDEDLALGTIMLENQARYSIKHHVHTAIVCNIIAKKLGWQQPERVSLTSAALTMNIGMLELQDQLHYQKEPLSNYQRMQVQRHPIDGMERLKKLGIADELWCNAVMQHHEALDGSGYPNALKAEEIIPAARILSLSDIYCARVSGRDYRPPLSPTMAMKEIFLNGKIDADLGMLFIKNLGIYPPGTFVRLKNNEIAVVTQRGGSVNSPIVHTVVKANGTPSTAPLRRDTSAAEFTVTALIPADKAGVDVNRYQLWGYGIFKRAKTLKRKEERAPVNVPAMLLDMRTITTTHATIINVSEGGCMLKILPGSGGHLHINLSLHVTFKVLNFIVENATAIIKNIQEKPDVILVGMQFTEISETNKDNIRSFLNSLEQ